MPRRIGRHPDMPSREAQKPPCARLHAVLLLLLAAIAPMLSGCEDDELPSGYGRVDDPAMAAPGYFSESVNGTRVLFEMFRAAGHNVETCDRFSQRLEQADCLVWFMPNHPVPSVEAITLLEGWLENGPNRTLILVGPGYDAEIDYWRKVLPEIEGINGTETKKLKQKAEGRQDLAETLFAFRHLNHLDDGPVSCEWFSVEGRRPPDEENAENEDGDTRERSFKRIEGRELVEEERKRGSVDEEREDWIDSYFQAEYYEPFRVTQLSGERRWTEHINVEEAEILLYDRMIPGDDMDVLLECEDGMLVGRQHVGQGQLLVVANGSFLLNMPLVNTEHRRLAGKLVAEVGDTPQRVYFLQAWDDMEEDDAPPEEHQAPVGLILLQLWPANVVFFHCLALGIVIAFFLVPIFGRRKRMKRKDLADFGEHINAMADMLEDTGDVDYCRRKIEQYQAMTEDRKKRPPGAPPPEKAP